MKNKQEILKKICQKKYPNDGKYSSDELIRFYDKLVDQYGVTVADYFLLGWLKSKDTMVAVFGEENVCPDCGVQYEEAELPDYPEHGIFMKCDCGLNKDVAFQEAFVYHHNQTAGFTAIETLNYMARYLKD